MYRCLVLLSTYNGEKYLPELLDSVMAQKDVLIDVLARDDGSKDKTVEILKKNDRVQVYTGENLKPAKSFLDLILKADASYDYYALCDQDDVWKADKVISAIEHIKDSNKPTLYSSAVEVVDRDLNFIRKSFTDNSFKDPLYDILTYGTPGCTFVFNKALMQKLKEYKPTTISMHDSWISFVCLAVNGLFYSDHEAYILYRQHDANVLGAQRHSLKDTLAGIIKNKNVLRSDMAKEILIGYSYGMSPKTKEAFCAFAEYKENFRYKMRILRLPYKKEKTSKRAFEKIKLRILFGSV
ncbi:MAG: glycosyltransferase [Ruminococcus bromii]|jgi:glycosyltransferase involved in cell wall biosynthesis|nr:glycosyltransferase [Ruminococcus bromii]MEE0007847.1 glycosyltransferase [Ruminococcus bromii]